jgi:DNA-binding transcriptional LysR family regulator
MSVEPEEGMDRRLIRDLDILTLQLFVAICEQGTLTRAAQQEAIAPSAVSKRLGELESALGVELFVRGAKGMVLTAPGETMLHHARNMLQNVETIGAELKEYSQGIRGYIRIRANISAIVQFLPEDLKTFLSSHPDIKIDLMERPSRAIVDEIENGTADLGICSGDVDARHLSTILYRHDRLVLVVNPAHRLAERHEIDFRDTLDFDHIGLHVDSSIFARSLTAARQADAALRLKIHVPGFDALCRMVQANLGIGIIPDRAFTVIGKPLGLLAIQIKDEWSRRDLKIVHHGAQTLSVAARLLLDDLSGIESRLAADTHMV